MTREEIEAALARADVATPGQWNTKNRDHGHNVRSADGDLAWLAPQIRVPGRSISMAEASLNATFIAAARTDVPALAAALLRVLALADEYEAEEREAGDDALWGSEAIAEAIRAAVGGDE